MLRPALYIKLIKPPKPVCLVVPRKKKDNSLPSCALCVCVSRSCNYSTELADSERFQLLQKVRRLEEQLDSHSNHGSPVSSDSRRSTSRTPLTSLNGLEESEQSSHGVPAAFFLDATAFAVGKYSGSRHSLQLPRVFEDICPTSTVIWNIVDSYFIMYEERRRVWWGIIVLDRCVALGNPGLALSAEDLSRRDCLPTTEVAWKDNHSIYRLHLALRQILLRVCVRRVICWAKSYVIAVIKR